MASNKLNSFRITVILVVFVVLCYVDWSPSTGVVQRTRRSPLGTRATKTYDSCEKSGEIGVTFDEGPSKLTKDILDTLKTNNVKATFHLDPTKIADNIDVSKSIIENGNIIGLQFDKTLDTEKIKNMKVSEIKEELEKEAKIIKDALNVNPKFLRIPEGLEENESILQAAEELGFVITTWTVELSGNKSSSDYIKSYTNALKTNNKSNLKIYPQFIDRNIDSDDHISEAWKEIIKSVNDNNAKIVTLDTCLNMKEAYRTDGDASSSTTSSNSGESKSASIPKAISSLSIMIISIISLLVFII
ncbi:glycoside hydrolase/deacetylase [Neocallimastix californiae]|uniref:Glycoside hydrolase/deacetylase n=1 Tax=Neocallimastix californiae TaxID=1754190 RepID=A0A1Y2DC05_9FUNG|nr:glycoside hydrolase/deacetylase [Neocallimastix californiae]|eukprot:ORY56727.1 glycoside hydrolase/deacetylase [Neocallimastix californiae]